MSDVLHAPVTFLSLYERDRVTDGQLDDFIAAWHDSGDDEQRSLAEFLGMTDMEYAVSLMAPDSLPLIRRARLQHVPLRTLLDPYLASLRESAGPVDRSVALAVTSWLRDQPA